MFQVKFQVYGKVESASANSRISEQMSCKQKVCKFVVHLVTTNQGFRFQKNKNVRFISGNFSSGRFSWKVKTIRGGLYILINKHLQYQCLEFTILKRTWPMFAKTIINSSLEFRVKTFRFLTNDYDAKFRQTAFSESVRISHEQHLPPKFFQYLLFLYARDLKMSRLT